ncbi:DUF2617 family protein [Streptomyces sp. MS06]|uniref:DUF2617 family protein n=1 Tax=Streptomyces sp. MS06 TaxID=3385974 RepID=UPI0039A27B7D
MHTVALDTPYLDTDADQLSLSLDTAELPALAEREVAAGGLSSVRLRVLGASHQVFAGPVRETVACLPGGTGGLPVTRVRELPGWRYEFGARVQQYDGQSFGSAVARILDLAAGGDRSLCGVFPGSPQAVTAVLVETLDGNAPGGLGWRTWHTYPQHRRIVSTCTRLEAR